jgi:UDP-N-acetylmuramoyl-tripeptide--D-alanyl-D-alanine ligase
MKASIKQLQSGVFAVGTFGAATFDGVTTDSRQAAAGNLFIALRGENYDAHDFLPQVAHQGVAAVVVEKLPPGWALPALVVPDTRIALGQIGRFWRRKFAIPVIGVTGSNGKTTVKEMIAAILTAAYGADHALATRGNLNNEIGVPLTLMRLQTAHRAAVVEMGMNHPGEIATLAKLAEPTVGLVNNAQREHQEFMQSVEAVARENGALLANLPANGVAVFPAGDPFTPLWRALAGPRKCISFGLSDDADVRCRYQATQFGNDIQVTVQKGHDGNSAMPQFSCSLAAAGEHNVRNALAAIACTLAIGIDGAAIARGLAAFVPVSGRLQLKRAGNAASVIDDTYNANPDSVRAAIEVLAQAAAPRVLVLGDMGEVGDQGRQFHEEIGAYAAHCGVEKMLCMGPLARYASAAFCAADGAASSHYETMESLLQAVYACVGPDTTVLVKGSRFMQMERVVQHLIGQHLIGQQKAPENPNNLQEAH